MKFPKSNFQFHEEILFPDFPVPIFLMRPFKIGDKIKIGGITGIVLEKALLVTRIRTIKNEEITIPNSAVLSGNTTNYTTMAKTEGLTPIPL